MSTSGALSWFVFWKRGSKSRSAHPIEKGIQSRRGIVTQPHSTMYLAKAIVIVGLATFADGLKLRGGPTDSAQLVTYETEYLQKQAQAQVAEEKYKTLLQSTMTGSMGFTGGTGSNGVQRSGTLTMRGCKKC